MARYRSMLRADQGGSLLRHADCSRVGSQVGKSLGREGKVYSALPATGRIRQRSITEATRRAHVSFAEIYSGMCQAVLGHTEVEAMMLLYTQLLNRGGRGSPQLLDRLRTAALAKSREILCETGRPKTGIGVGRLLKKPSRLKRLPPRFAAGVSCWADQDPFCPGQPKYEVCFTEILPLSMCAD